MTTSPRSYRTTAIVLLLLLLAVLFAVVRCVRPKDVAAAAPAAPDGVASKATPQAATAAPSTPVPSEVLTPATLQAAAEVAAGGLVRVAWTGPDNAGDYITIVRPDAAPEVYANYAETRRGNPLEVPAPMDAGAWELRYVTARSKTVLGRAALTVQAVTATLRAPGEAILGATISVEWTGPNNAGDYVTVAAAGAPDDRYENYAETKAGSPLKLAMPVEAGAAEIRYVAAQGRKVLARRAVSIVAPATTLSAVNEVIAGAAFEVTWTGPKNPGDYITIVPKGTPDGRYHNYGDVAKGSPLSLTAPIGPGEAELRYMTGTKARVLARRPITVVAAVVTLEAASSVPAGASVEVRWSGPNHRGDYITLVPKTTPDGQYGNYADTARGNPVKIAAPKSAGEAELRYVSGQGARVLSRRAIQIIAAD